MTSDRNYKTSLIIQDRTLLSPVDLPKPFGEVVSAECEFEEQGFVCGGFQ